MSQIFHVVQRSPFSAAIMKSAISLALLAAVALLLSAAVAVIPGGNLARAAANPGPIDLTLPIGIPTLTPPAKKDAAFFTLTQPINDKDGNDPFIVDAKGNAVGNPKWKPTYQVFDIKISKIDPIAAADRFNPAKLSAASKVKAEVIADEIGAKLGDKTRVSVDKGDVTKIVTGSMRNPAFNPRFPVTIFNQPFLPVYSDVQLYKVVTTNISKFQIKENFTGENGDGAQFNPGKINPRGSTSSARMTGLGFDASGMDAFGDPSFVEFGTDAYRAILFPFKGESDATILQQIAEDLTKNGISAMFDALTDTVSLLSPLAEGGTLFWGWTDITLGFDVALDSSAAQAPEPSALLLLASGLAALGFVPRWREARVVRRPRRLGTCRAV